MAEIFNAAEYLVTRHLADGRADHVAVVGDSPLTYAELDGLIGNVAAAYRSQGLHRDDRVVLVMSDDVPMLAGILGAFRAGMVAVPVSTMYNGEELGEILADSGAHLVMCSAEYAAAVSDALAHAPDVEHVVVSGSAALSAPEAAVVHTWDDFVALGAGSSDEMRVTEPTSGDAWALWLYTSGTTGQPKAAMHRHANIRHVCETYGAQVLATTADDRTLSIAKMFFAYGIGNSVFFPLSTGATTILEPRRPAPDVVADRIRKDRPTLFFGVPTFYAALVASDLPDDTFASVRMAVSAGEPLPAPLQKRFTERFGAEILDGIGSTEALHIFLSNRPGDIRPGTTGTAVPGYDVEVRGPAGEALPAGEPGALFVRGESIAMGYWHRADASRQVFQGEWLSTGDTYVRDADGYFQCLGRNSDMLKAGGIWVSPAEVESRLMAHSAVREAAVVGVPDADGLVKPIAVVVVNTATDEHELVEWCRDGLAHFKAPRHVIVVDDLPKTATGKLQRFKVRDMVTGDGALTVAPAPAQASS